MSQAKIIVTFIIVLIVSIFLIIYLAQFFIYDEKSEQLNAPHCKCSPLSSNLFKPTNYRVVNGREVTDPNDFSYSIGMVYRKNETFQNLFCSGSIITPSFVLSAGHCTKELLFRTSIIKNIYILSGLDHDLNKLIKIKDNYRKIKNLIVHRDYVFSEDGESGSLYADIALIELDQPFEFNEKTKIYPACLYGHRTYNSSYLVQAGYGLVESYSKKIKSRTFEGLTTISKNKSYLPKLKMTHFNGIIDLNYYLKIWNPQSSICNGDSGSGLAHLDSNRLSLIGVLSSVEFKKRKDEKIYCKIGSMAYAVSIAYYMQFIIDNVKDVQNLCHTRILIKDRKKVSTYYLAVSLIMFMIGICLIMTKNKKVTPVYQPSYTNQQNRDALISYKSNSYPQFIYPKF